MSSLFGISHAEAVARINSTWADLDFTRGHDLIGHEEPGHWAHVIY
ncbi:hypothetical protein [Streptomyces meridianus]|uniref:Uncharacterized protein n=1 Tax=Streptomyces meridianus TaxID=2938945 RepID=A0ABT0X866_9ACTN|nr:hypothetical protein [Streptomyces meridianus]MCM2578725.1 hypothetical protein [Streptomyces meridianus]